MNISRLNNYNSAPDEAFESFCTQLFRRWLQRSYPIELSYFTVVNGAGGDGGVEAYSVMKDGSVIGLQAKYFLNSVNHGQRDQIENSIRTAKDVRPELKQYVICFPRKRFSKKKGKDGVLTEGNEEHKLNALLAEINVDFPDLKIELWFEDRLLEELGEPGSEGIKRYWFDKEEISLDSLRLRFDLAKAGWLMERYVPDLHHAGKIASCVDELLYTPKFISEQIRQIREARNKVQFCSELILSFTRLNTISLGLNTKLTELRDSLIDHIKSFEMLLVDLDNQVFPLKITVPEELDIWPLILEFEKLPKINTLRNLSPKLRSALNEVHQIHLRGYLKDLKELFSPRNYTILGPVGTGKTHALANAVESRLEIGCGAMIVRARESDPKSWGNILRGYLDCCNGWSDEEIFNGLESLAIRRSITEARGKKTGEKFLDKSCRILICIDGIDEAKDWPLWRMRLLEAQEWIEKMPLIRFIATARSYPPTNMNPCDLPGDGPRQIRVDLPHYGDYVLRSLIPEYLNAYGIVYDPNSWILDAFENGLTLRLFCEIHQGQNISSYSSKPANFTLGSLLKIKIDRLEMELQEKFPGRFASDEQLIFRVLVFLAEEFMTAIQIEREVLRERIFQAMSGVLEKSIIGHIMMLLADHGFLQVQHVPALDSFSLDKKLYGTGIQSYMEYLLAMKYAAMITKDEEKTLPKVLLEPVNDYIRTLTAIVLFNDYNILVGTDDYWTTLESIKLLRLQFAVMKNSSDELVIPHLHLIKSKFLASYVERDLVVNEFILPNLHRQGLRLGIDFIHKTLNEFPDTYSRDLFWSAPDHHEYIENSHLSLYLKEQRIYFFARYDQTPLLMAWSLSSINNDYRAYCRAELSSWAAYNLEGFVRLLGLIWGCGDPQIQEDLSTVMRGIVPKINAKETKIRLLVNWILGHIFDLKIIGDLTNSVIRLGALSFIQRAHSLGICTDEELALCSPPYAFTEGILELDLTSHPLDSSHDGRFPIQDDLDWYVIKEAYRMFLPHKSGGGLNKIGQEFIEPYQLKYNVKLNQHQFAVAAAIFFIRKLGWNRETGAAWDGSSGWATFEEKYTHLAVHKIQGFLADRLPYEEYGSEERLSDYGKLLHISNPADHDSKFNFEYYHKDANRWFLPEDIAEPLIYGTKATQEQIEEWTTHPYIPDFKKWIYAGELQWHGSATCSDDWIVLYSSTSLSEPFGVGRARLSIVCVLIDQEKLDKFKTDLEDANSGVCADDLKPDDLRADIAGGVYHSVTDVVLMEKEEEEPEKWISTDNESFEVFSTVAEVQESNGYHDGDLFSIPSLIVRKALNICATDGRGFFTADSSLLGLRYKNYENTNDQQEVTLIDKSSFRLFLLEKNLVPVWIAENFRSTNSESENKDKDAHWQNTTKWVVFDDHFNAIELHNDYFS